MGNCLMHKSSIRFTAEDDDDDWEDFQAAEKGGSSFASSSSGGKKRTTEVKIKITKKQLEELVRKVHVKELRVEQVLAQLMKHSLQRPWRPALQSIPED